VDPYALRCLRERGIATTGLRSKGCDAFFGAYRPAVRFLITLSEVGGATTNWDVDTIRPTTAHWGMLDPSTVVGGETHTRAAFDEAFHTLDVRIQRFLALPLGSLNGRSLTHELRQIGETA
jgi:arsenate reductase